MLLSMLMLFIFMIQWIRSQYREAETRLHNDTQQLFTTVNNNIKDSLLNRQVVTLMQHSTDRDTLQRPDIYIKDSVLSKTDVATHKSVHLYTYQHSSTKLIPQKEIISPSTIKIDSLRTPEDKEIADKVLRIALQEIINNIDTKAFRTETDSALLKNKFSLALEQHYKGLNVVWAALEDNNESFFSFRSNDTGHNSVYLALEGYHLYLFKAILPQLAFCFLLLLLTGLAFILAYLNTRKQLLFVQQKDEFISNISHELKTPVATAKIAIEALNKYNAIEDPERTRRYLSMASWELNRLETMIGKIMETTQADHGVLILNQQKIHLPELVQEITSSLQAVLLQENITLRLDLQAKDAYVLADNTHLTGAIYNLLDNAIKYGNKLISIGIYQEQKTIHLKITDNGPGIPAAYREKIFEKFVRVPQENIHNVKGYGLGLSYARYIIEAHKGNLKLEQRSGMGAIFHISIPKFPPTDEI